MSEEKIRHSFLWDYDHPTQIGNEKYDVGKPCYIAFEAPMGAGKSTIVNHLMAQYGLDKHLNGNKKVKFTREVGYTDFGKIIRKHVYDYMDNPEIQLHMLQTDRLLTSIHIREYIKEGNLVISDRCILSTIAHQIILPQILNYPKNREVYTPQHYHKKIKALLSFCKTLLFPDIIIYLDVPPTKRYDRVRSRLKSGDKPCTSNVIDEQEIIYYIAIQKAYEVAIKTIKQFSLTELNFREKIQVYKVNADIDISKMSKLATHILSDASELYTSVYVNNPKEKATHVFD